MARAAEHRGYPGWLLVAAPLAMLAAAVLVWVGIDVVGEVGPLDKAKLGGLVAVPLTIVVPVLGAWAGGNLGRFGRPVLAAMIGLGAGVAVGWPVWTEFSGQCEAVGLPIPVSPIATIGVIVGATMFAAVLAAGVAVESSRSGPTRTVLAVGSVMVVFAIGFAVFAVMSSSLLFGQCVVRPGITP